MTTTAGPLFSAEPDDEFAAAAGLNTQPVDKLDARPDAALASKLFGH